MLKYSTSTVMKFSTKFSLVAVAIAILVYLCEQWYGLVTRAVWFSHAVKTLAKLDSSDFHAFVDSYDVFDNPKHTDEDEVKVNAVYKVLVPLMELGQLTKFYIPPLMDPERGSFPDLGWNQELFERKMADTMQLEPGKVALDIGCGQGLVADMVQEQSGAKVVGINISPEQIAKAKANAAASGKLGNVLEFDIGSMNDKLAFDDESFDAVYVVQSTCYAHDFGATMAEVARVLKPGGIFSDLAVTTLDNYDADNETHVRMAGEAKRVGVIPIWRSAEYYLDGEWRYKSNFAICLASSSSSLLLWLWWLLLLMLLFARGNCVAHAIGFVSPIVILVAFTSTFSRHSLLYLCVAFP